MSDARGIEALNRRRIDLLHRELGRPFSVKEAADALRLEPAKARTLLAGFAARGWLSRIRRDAYSLVPLGAASPGEWREDPWSVAAYVFAPCYLGGWTAGEHWSLTEQLFRDIIVYTSRRMHERVVTLQGTTFRLRSTRPEHFFGLSTVWRGQSRISVSGPSRTVVDLLDDPTTGGGMRNVVDMVAAYFGSEHRADAALRDYIGRLGNRAVFKRLGFLLESQEVAAPALLAACRAGISRGLSLLDPAGPKHGRVVKRWNLRVNLVLEDAP